MPTYQEIKNNDPVLFECFFAFSKSQLEEGIKKVYEDFKNKQGVKVW